MLIVIVFFIVVFLLVLFDLAVLRWGVNSRSDKSDWSPRFESDYYDQHWLSRHD